MPRSQHEDREHRALWERYRGGGPAHPRSPCLEPNALAAYIDGRLPDDARPRLEAHLACCPSCREQLGEARAILAADTLPVPPDTVAAAKALVTPGACHAGILPRLRREVAWWAAAAAIAAAASFAGYRIGRHAPDLDPSAIVRSENTLDPLTLDGPGA